MKIFDREIKAVIFDMDGTLVDSTGIWAEIDREFFKKRGIDEVPKEYAQDIVHMGLLKGAQMTIERYGFKNDTVEGIIKEWRESSVRHYSDNIPLKKGALELLNYLKSAGVRIALATANDEELYLPCLDRLGIKDFFEIIIDVNKVKEGKSSPKIYDEIAKQFNVDKSETMVIEDTLVGLKTAYNAGYFAVAIYDKASEPIDKEKHQYSYIYIDALDELIN